MNVYGFCKKKKKVSQLVRKFVCLGICSYERLHVYLLICLLTLWCHFSFYKSGLNILVKLADFREKNTILQCCHIDIVFRSIIYLVYYCLVLFSIILYFYRNYENKHYCYVFKYQYLITFFSILRKIFFRY